MMIFREFSNVLKNFLGTQNLASRRKEVIVSPSSEGIERQTRYLGLLAQRDLSRELVFEANRAS